MGIIVRQSIKNSIITYIGVVIGTINVLFLYNKFLSPVELGLYTALTSFPLVFSSFASLGTPHVGVRFFHYFADDKAKHNGFLNYLLLTPFIGFLLFLVVYFAGRSLFENIYEENSPMLVRYYRIFAVITFFMIYMVVLEAYARVHLRIVVPAIIRELFMKLSNSTLAILFGFGIISFDQLIYGLVLTYFLAVIFLIVYIRILGKLYFKWDFSFLNKPVFGEMWQYGLWTILGGATATILPHIEKLMLPAYEDGLRTTAIFMIASSIGLVIAIPRNSMASISDPVLARAWKENNLGEISMIYRKSALNLLIVGLFLFLGIWCNIDAIFRIIPKQEIYSQGKIVVLLVGLYNVVDMSMGPNSEILKNSPYYRYDFAFYVLRFVALFAANLVLIPIYSYDGAAMAMLISVVIYNFTKFGFIWYKIGIQPFNRNTIKVLLIGAVTYVVTMLIPVSPGDLGEAILSIALKSACIVGLFGGAVIGLKVSGDLNGVLFAIWNKGMGLMGKLKS